MQADLIDVAADYGVEFSLVGEDAQLDVCGLSGAPTWLVGAIAQQSNTIRNWLRWQRIESRLNRPMMADDADELRAELAAMGLSDAVKWERHELNYG